MGINLSRKFTDFKTVERQYGRQWHPQKELVEP